MLTDVPEFVAILREQITALHNRQAEIMVPGGCKDWADYQRGVGYVTALIDVRKTISEVCRKSEKDE